MKLLQNSLETGSLDSVSHKSILIERSSHFIGKIQFKDHKGKLPKRSQNYTKIICNGVSSSFDDAFRTSESQNSPSLASASFSPHEWDRSYHIAILRPTFGIPRMRFIKKKGRNLGWML